MVVLPMIPTFVCVVVLYDVSLMEIVVMEMVFVVVQMEVQIVKQSVILHCDLHSRNVVRYFCNSVLKSCSLHSNSGPYYWMCP